MYVLYWAHVDLLIHQNWVILEISQRLAGSCYRNGIWPTKGCVAHAWWMAETESVSSAQRELRANCGGCMPFPENLPTSLCTLSDVTQFAMCPHPCLLSITCMNLQSFSFAWGKLHCYSFVPSKIQISKIWLWCSYILCSMLTFISSENE
jgi:hypothetical protein